MPDHAIRDRYLQEIYDEVERVYPEFVRPASSVATWWSPVSPMQTCACGTRIVLLEDSRGERRWCQVGRPDTALANAKQQSVRLPVHTDERCRELGVLQGAMEIARPAASSRRSRTSQV